MRYWLRNAVLGLAGTVIVSSGCTWFGEARAVGKPPDMLLVTTARSSGSEVSLSRIASERSTNADVKRFAQLAMTDHEKMIQEIRKLAERRGTSIMPVPDEINEKLAAHLRELSGEELDREYMKEMVAEHAKMAAKFEAEARQEQDPIIRQWAEQQIPIFQDHLQMAQTIHEKLTAVR